MPEYSTIRGLPKTAYIPSQGKKIGEHFIVSKHIKFSTDPRHFNGEDFPLDL